MVQQMDENIHEMVNMLTQHKGTMFKRLILNTIQSYRRFSHQIGKIVDFFGAPQAPLMPNPNNLLFVELLKAFDGKSHVETKNYLMGRIMSKPKMISLLQKLIHSM